METNVKEIAQRIKGLRELLEITAEEMAADCNVPLEQYLQHESGELDFTFTFLYDCARVFGIDIVELITGDRPKLSFYTVVRSGKGLPIRREKGFTYRHLAYRMKNKLTEPFLVTAPYSDEEQKKPIPLTRHRGQEFNYVLQGTLKVQIDDHIETLEEGDSILYNSFYGKGHGMVAAGGKDCTFLAFVVKEETEGLEEEESR
ncbi:XRE family transcriptional regulator [Bacteroides sp. OttesenSCG-928-J23]|nr:XRE family transcriptional regulator [Bacteroides sp. OttesenSCG-928-J23]